MTTARPEGLNLANWQEPRNLHWAFQHMDDLFPVTPFRAGGRTAELDAAPAVLTDLPVALAGGGASTVSAILDDTSTDAWLVLQGSRIVAEEYRGGMTADTRHLLMSVSKSLVSSVVGALVMQGRLDVSRRIEDYIPELAGAGYGEATVRQVLDMRSGIHFSEEYLDPASEVRGLDAAVGWAPASPGRPASLKAFLASLRSDREHGGYFQYRSCETDVLGWLCETVSGRPFAELASEVLWSPLGASEDAFITVDSEGMGMFDGGICATTRDLARFGAMIRDGGLSLTGERVLSEAWVEDIFSGGADSDAAFAAGPEARHTPGGKYRSQFWFLSGRRDVAYCLGIHGQMIYIDRSSGVVGVKFSSIALPVDPQRGPAAAAMFETIGAHLGD
ncbi:serine hydrolase domain-containing protein [Arthrobacter sp. NPDC090010]|uniref:serine hydrolase domain-containing protein n=1 Tax=Arthrobacter sp. NPDC090010 TaxID=3363942 RepID=UPI00380E2D30